MILEPIHSSCEPDPATEQSIIQEIRQAVKNAIIQTRETNVDFDDLDFVVDDFSASSDAPESPITGCCLWQYG
jgi:hypothetical protein